MREDLDLSKIDLKKIAIEDVTIDENSAFNVKTIPAGHKFILPERRGQVKVVSSTTYKHEVIAEAFVMVDPDLRRMYENLKKRLNVDYLPYKDFLIFELQALAVYDKNEGYARSKVEASDTNSTTINQILSAYIQNDYQVDFQDPLYRQKSY